MTEPPPLPHKPAPLISPATVGLILINVGVFAAAERSGSTLEVETLLRFGASQRELVWGGEYWRLFTPMFLHIGPIHLLWNAVAGFSWCAKVESAVGWRRFLAIYLLSGVAGSAVSVIGHDVVSAGASGALFGVVGVELVLAFRRLGSRAAFLGDRVVRRQLVNIGIWFAIGLSTLAMDNHAHAGGFVCGLLLGWQFTEPVVRKPAVAFSIAGCWCSPRSPPVRCPASTSSRGS